jgi:hypothetical protein
MTFLARCRRGLQRISPYLSLLVLLVPLLLVEPLKLAALLVAGSGHWLAAAAILVAAYAASLLVIERLFRVLKPKIMMMGWFNRLWTGFIALRTRLIGGWSFGGAERRCSIEVVQEGDQRFLVRIFADGREDRVPIVKRPRKSRWPYRKVSFDKSRTKVF